MGRLSILVCVCAMVLPAVADELPADSVVVRSLSRTQVQELLLACGLEVTLKPDVTESEPVTAKMRDYNFEIYFYDDSTAIQFHTSFGDVDVSLRALNSFHERYRYGRSYLDENGDPHLEVDLDLGGGVTVGALKEFIATCDVVFGYWLEEVILAD